MIQQSDQRIHPRAQGKKSFEIGLQVADNFDQEHISEKSSSTYSAEANKQNYKLFQEVSKLISLYSGSQSSQALTKQQFKQLAIELYATVDRSRILSQGELNNLVNLFDSDKDATISREQIISIVSDSRTSKVKQF